MNTRRPRPVLGDHARVVTLASSPEPEGVASNIGHPTDPVVVALSLNGPEPVVVLSEGSGHLGSGGTFRLDEILDGSGTLQVRWGAAFDNADALWVVPLFGRLAAGDVLAEQTFVDAYRRRHGADPVIRTGPSG